MPHLPRRKKARLDEKLILRPRNVSLAEWPTSGKENEVIDWMAFYNHRRRQSTLGYVSPMQFDKK